MNIIWNLGLNTFREAIRNRVLYVILVFATLFILASRLLGSISVGEDVKVVMDMGLAGISIFSVLIAIFVGTGLIYQEIERRTIYTILSKPVQRSQFILGKYLGLCLTLTLVVLGMSLVFFLQLWLVGAPMRPTLVVAILLGLMEVYLVTAVAVFLSAISSPLLSAVFTLCFYLIGHTSQNILHLLQWVDQNFLRKSASALYFILPNLNNFNYHRQVVHGLEMPWNQITLSVLYGLLYITLMLTFAVLGLKNREL